MIGLLHKLRFMTASQTVLRRNRWFSPPLQHLLDTVATNFDYKSTEPSFRLDSAFSRGLASLELHMQMAQEITTALAFPSGKSLQRQTLHELLPLW